MWKKRILAFVFSAVLALTTAVPAFAHHKPGHHPPGHNGGNRQTQSQQQAQAQEQHQCILVLGLLQPATC
jgi:hypothetical protein